MRRGGQSVGVVAATLAAALLATSVASCAPNDASAGQAGGTQSSGPDRATGAPPARQGREAASSRVRFAPDRLELPDGTVAPIDPAVTVRGVLRVPESVERVGWWDGGAFAGDPFGATVVAGHVDSSRQGLGAFAALLDVRPGEQVVLEGEGHRAVYEVTSVDQVDKDALATSSDAFGQLGTHRLVLITCTGAFDPQRRSYDQNLVVVAAPVGPPA